MSNHPQGLTRRGNVWHIQTTVRVGRLSQRIRESTGCTSVQSAAEYLENRKLEVTRELLAGPKVVEHTFREAAVEYVLHLERRGKATELAEIHLSALDGVLGHLPLSHVHQGTLAAWIEEQHGVRRSSTVRRYLTTVTSVLNYAARVLRDGNRPWLATVPPKLIPPDWSDGRKPYSLSWDEQDRLVAELPGHLVPPVLFAVSTGAREAEITTLRWEQECKVTGLEPGSVWWIPPAVRKGSSRKSASDQEGRYLVCNRTARSVIDRQRGNGSAFVFPGPKGEGMERLNNTGFRNARKKAGLRCRFHDCRHTFGERMAAAGVPWDYRKAILGHAIKDVTALYSAPGLARMLEEVEKITREAATVLRPVDTNLTQPKRKAAR